MSGFIKVGTHIIKKEYIYDVFINTEGTEIYIYSFIPAMNDKNVVELNSIKRMDTEIKILEDALLKDDPKDSDVVVGNQKLLERFNIDIEKEREALKKEMKQNPIT